VLRGEQSLVGPPATDRTRDFAAELGVSFGKPGLTGLAQLQQNLSAEEEEQFLLYYARNQSFILDVEILFKAWSQHRHAQGDAENTPWQK
jgi:lipopolysaccharide/colanic/teichoic acid biosynthesis glycosyltransferase